MGQKIHPIGFRVGITKKYRAQWFARFSKHQYSQAVLEDHMIRQTLEKLFGGNSPELMNTNMKKVKKSGDSPQLTPKITQIKIERGLIPYEIGIQIHAGNCELIKSAIDNLKINQTLTHNLQKSRCYLMDLKSMLTDLIKWKRTLTSVKKKFKLKLAKNRFFSINQKLVLKRLRKRRGIRRNFRQSVLGQVLMVKKGRKLTRKIQNFSKLNSLKENSKKIVNQREKEGFSRNPLNTGAKKRSLVVLNGAIKQKTKSDFTPGEFIAKASPSGDNPLPIKGSFGGIDASKGRNSNPKSHNKSGVISRQGLKAGLSTKRKFITFFVNKMNQSFLVELKSQMKYWNNFISNYTTDKKINGIDLVSQYERTAPLGYDRKWSLSRLENFKKQPLPNLCNLVKYLQSKALLKLDILRDEFVSLGSLSKIQTFAYYQMMTFIKNLKLLVKKLAKEQSKFQQKSMTRSLPQKIQNKQKVEKWLSSVPEIALQNKLNNLDNEGRKLKFIYYLKDLVKKHRTDHVYYYLSTIADSRESLKKIQHFQKKNISFLFGMDSQFFKKDLKQLGGANPMYVDELADQKSTLRKEQIQNNIKNIYLQTSQKSDLDKGLQEAFLEQLQKQKIMHQQNIQLTPKILIKFYSVKESSFQSKASLVADSIVDDLEKRKVFRRVIKQAKENLMLNSGVKGVKIQVAGRLNGAEIARTEWVRSGRVPLQTLRANIDYSYKTASTIYGIIGVKVWIYKGYAKTRSVTTPFLLDFLN
jgi:ribosomal protein S3